MARGAFVWLTFALMATAAAWVVRADTGPVPVQDDYYYQTLRLDSAFPSGEALWAQLNEHRYPLPRLFTWAVGRVAGPGVVAGAAANLALGVLAAAGVLLAVRRARGRWQFGDALVPLAVLNVSDGSTRVWAVQVHFYLPEALALAAAGVLAAGRADLGRGRLAAAWVLASLLTLCGVVGILLGSSLGVWLLAVAGLRWRVGQRAVAAASALGGLGVLALAASAFVGYTVPRHSDPPSLGPHTVEHFLRMLATAWGGAAERVRQDGWPAPLGLATAALVVVTAGALARAARRGPAPAASLGLLAHLGGLIAAAAAGAYGRAFANQPGGGPVMRSFVTLLSLLLPLLYVAWLRVGGRAAARLRGALFLGTVAAAWPNFTHGEEQARGWYGPQEMIRYDLYARLPASALAEKYAWYVNPLSPAPNPADLKRLRDARVGPFRYLAPERPLGETPLTWSASGAVAHPAGGFAPDERLGSGLVRVVFTGAGPLDGVLLRYTLHPGGTDGHARYDRPSPEGRAPDRLTHLNALAPGAGRAVKLWVGPGCEGFTLTFAGPTRLELLELTGLTYDPLP